MGTAPLWLLVGLVCVALGAETFVAGAEGVAVALGVPDDVLGLTLFALGTSLPELVTTVAAARQGHPELAIGNVAGSNLFNLLFVFGATATVMPIPVTPDMRLDVAVMCVFALLAFPLFSRAHRVGRRHGVLLLTGYAVYIGWLVAHDRIPA